MKDDLVTRLEIIASSLEDDLPRRLQSDIATDSWLQQMTGQNGPQPSEPSSHGF